jgi:hypothetical protein
MLREARATRYVHHTSSDVVEVSASGITAKTVKASGTLLLDAQKALVGVDLRETDADAVLMIGAHENVVSQVESDVRVQLDAVGELTGVRVEKASRAITDPAKNPYI